MGLTVSNAKYRNMKTDGYSSKAEARRAAELKLLQKAGTIRNLREQVRYELIPKQGDEHACHYVADFEYEVFTRVVFNKDSVAMFEAWKTVVEDCKGMKTRDYIIKRKLMLFRHGIRILETN